MTTDTGSDQAGGILLAAPPPPPRPAAELIRRAAREAGVGPVRQLMEMRRLRRRPNGVSLNEYYDLQLYRADLATEEKRAFVGAQGSHWLNERLSPLDLYHVESFVDSKLYLGAVLQQFGLPVTETQAVIHRRRRLGRLPVLQDVAAVERFLNEDARYPLFAKPVAGSRSVGSVLVRDIDRGAGALKLGDGREVALAAFAEEAFASGGRGVLLQSAVVQHPDMSAIAGEALGTVRVVTVRDEGLPEPLYAVWKLPAPRAMSDNFWQAGSLLAALDMTSGEIHQCRRGTGPDTEKLDVHPASGEALAGWKLPLWDEICSLASEAHLVVPGPGLLGWDIGVSAEGPVVVECNMRPFHTLYEFATGRGVLNPDFKPVFERIAARNAARQMEIAAEKRSA